MQMTTNFIIESKDDLSFRTVSKYWAYYIFVSFYAVPHIDLNMATSCHFRSSLNYVCFIHLVSIHIMKDGKISELFYKGFFVTLSFLIEKHFYLQSFTVIELMN